MTRIIGIDPGLYGGLASYAGGKEVYVYGFESGTAQRGSGNELNGHALADVFNYVVAGADHIFLEQVGAMPNEGPSGAFKFGTTFGIILGMVYLSGVPFTRVVPAKWSNEIVGLKTAEQVGKKPDKSRNMARARDLFPLQADQFRGSKEGGDQTKKLAEGKADAALIAYYGYCVITGRKFR